MARVDPVLVPRPSYLRLLASYRDTPDIKVLTGVRRCGKSTLLRLVVQDLRAQGVPEENVYYRRLDQFGTPVDPTASWLLDDVTRAAENAQAAHPFYVFLDEVQDVPEWERVVRRLHTRAGTDVYVTGSNAHLLSSDLATYLAGRYVQLEVFPLSFAEYLAFREAYGFPAVSREEAFADYLRFGGMPGRFELPSDDYEERLTKMLQTVCDTVVLNDVLLRTHIGDPGLLAKLVRYVFSTSGNLFSTRKIVQTLASTGRKTSTETLDNYLKALADAYVVGACEQEGVAGREVLRPLRKFYPVDSGLRNLMTGFSGADLGFQLEDVVYNELRRRGYGVRVGVLAGGEVDFVATRAGERLYVQVSETLLAEETYRRELAPYERIADSWPKYVLTLDRFRCGTTERGERVAYLPDWLLGE
jgi:hypothetical protein